MPTFYNFTEDGVVRSFDDVFIPADVFRNGNLFTWGYNYDSQLGVNDTTSRSTPVTTISGGTNWKQISCSGYHFNFFNHTAAIKTDGTLWVWGNNSTVQLGTNDTIRKSTPVTTFAGGTNWKQVSCGPFHTAAIKTDGTLWVWGNNNTVQLGTNDTIKKSTPVTTFAGGTNWKQVSTAYGYCIAIKTDGTLWSWGDNSLGQLAINDTTRRSTPVTTFAGGNNWTQVSAGFRHAAAVKTDGTLWTWGYNNTGQLAINTTTGNRSTPVTTFAGGTNWKQVACGSNSSGAIKTDGTLWVWGIGFNSGLGVADATNRSTPVTTFAGGTNWKQVSVGHHRMGAIKTDGTLWMWGSGNDGATGIFSSSPARSTPVTTFAGRTDWKQVSCGWKHTAAVTYIDSVI
jgi:alpha-tubulin suppressor-like RCC1 family protein